MEYAQPMLAAVVVLAMLGSLLWLGRRRGWIAAAAPRGPRRLEVLERLALGPQHTLHLVRIGDEALLVASSPAGCALLDRVPRANSGGARP